MSLAWEEAIVQLRVNHRKADMKWEPELFYAKHTYLGAAEKESFRGGCSNTLSVEGEERRRSAVLVCLCPVSISSLMVFCLAPRAETRASHILNL